ncbi:hypothetical protein CXG81DRAFT_19411 [Caulochytrium protostelioides]|uniref:Uncharacterized protein n=1 Tax=Caulochytrium protostelioides TaxID=1555241 RepID=A0A4P9X691_9FUNG|nr:hypothetical protein CXG81DRAFT_19411 [Caulochytrium protostelioides]|eukprot:RKP00685.1 hypothetical protein CXG81DRAFT_19411 [Caulochytrium protostelioides]
MAGIKTLLASAVLASASVSASYMEPGAGGYGYNAPVSIATISSATTSNLAAHETTPADSSVLAAVPTSTGGYNYVPIDTSALAAVESSTTTTTTTESTSTPCETTTTPLWDTTSTTVDPTPSTSNLAAFETDLPFCDELPDGIDPITVSDLYSTTASVAAVATTSGAPALASPSSDVVPVSTPDTVYPQDDSTMAGQEMGTVNVVSGVDPAIDRIRGSAMAGMAGIAAIMALM